MKHTKEPWKVDLRSGCCAIYPENKAQESNGCNSDHDRNICFSSKGSTYVDDPHGSHWDMDEQVQVDFKRIVACVNACAGITNEALEAGYIKHLVEWDEVNHNCIDIVDSVKTPFEFKGVPIKEDV